jgi:predicted CopG family antitoxin
MATKTISLELDAYEKLKRAKRSERESFSEVVRRAHWEDEASTGSRVLADLSELRARHPASFLSDEVLDQLDERVRARTVRSTVVADEGR